MEAASTVVVKVKYGDMLRRLNAQIIGEELDFTVDGLREKIRSLFNLSPDAELILTYIDEDGDVVHLVEADDIRDVVTQHLNPLRITVRLGSQPNQNQSSHFPGCSSPLRSPQEPPSLQNLHDGITEILKTVPGPLREKLVNLSNLTSKALTSSPHLAELVDTFSKVGLSYVARHSDSETGVQAGKNNEPENCSSQMENSEGLKKVQPERDVENDKVEVRNVTLKKLDKLLSRSRCMKAASSGHGSRNLYSAKKEKFNKFKGCYPKEKSPLIFPSSTTSVESESLCLENHPDEYSNKSLNPGKNLPTEVANKLSESPVEPKTTCTRDPDPMEPSGPSLTYRCPFSGIYSSGTGAVFHCGVRCDGCGIHPITGPRFKSQLKLDYDLCSICFSEMGNSTDYIRMDHPAVRQNHVSSNGFYNSVCNKSSRLRPYPTKLDSCFIEDVNVFDGTIMAPSTPFTKKWRMKNNGMVDWPQGTQLNWIGGDLLRKNLLVELEIPVSGVPVGQELNIAVDFVAPVRPGQYVSYWRMASPSGQQFGQRVWVLIQVDASVQTMNPVNISGLNLNLPPVSSTSPLNSPAVNLNPWLVPEDNQRKKVELVEPLVKMQPDKCRGTNFPINDSLLISNCPSSSSFINPQPLPETANTKEPSPEVPAMNSDPCAGLSIPDPIVHVLNSLTQAPAPISSSPQEAASELQGKTEVEEKHLREPEEMMGFKEIHVNKEILRMNKYDLDKASDDLCDVISGWDPILEELQEMGFHDTEVNKMLLEKNNGSITRVVMDLIAEEKI